MNRFICGVIFVASLFTSKNNNYEYYARSYVVLDYSSGLILESKSKDLVRSVASISKIMTAIIAIERTNLVGYVVANEDIKKGYGSSIYLQVGETVSMKDLVYGLMLRSGNDAALTIARGVSGSIEEFVTLMNDKARKIGMKNTIFNNPSGLDIDDEGNLSTSYDIAILMKYCLDNEIFRNITGTKEYRSESHGIWLNKNKLLRTYEHCIGGKTGFTTKARRTLVTSAKKGNTELIVVTLDCGGDFAFHKELYEKYFSSHSTLNILDKGNNVFDDYNLVCLNRINLILDNEDIKSGEIIYKIKSNKVEVIYKNNDGEEKIGECKAEVIDRKEKKKSWLSKLFRLK
jgi:D-alanyl-D-alanine carboxypeptidase